MSFNLRNALSNAFVGSGGGGTVTAPLLDTNGNELIKGVATASAVNELTVTNAAANGVVILEATGDDANIGLDIRPKGSDPVRIGKSGNKLQISDNGNVDSLEVFVGGGSGTAIGYSFGTAAKSGVICGVASGVHWTGGTPSAGVYTKGITGGTSGDIDINDANVSIVTAGKGLKIKEGSNAKMGVATLSGGTVVVSNTSITASTRIFLTVQSLGTVAVPMAVSVTARTASTSFTITSADVTDTSTVAWMLIEPG